MDWENERYVRLYTRDTVEWSLLSWRAQGLFALLMRKCDRAGILELGKAGKRGVSALIGGASAWPEIEPALDELLTDGCVQLAGDKLLLPNFMEAQEAKQSDKVRQQESRGRRRAAVKLQAVTIRDEVSQNVTECHTASHAVTRGHTASHGVTLAVPSLAEPAEPMIPPTPTVVGEPLALIPPAANDTPKRKPKTRKPLPALDAVRAEVLALVGVDYPDHTWDGLRALLTKGTSGDDALAYVRWAATQQWERETLRLDPVVLFRHSRFAAGLAKARAARVPYPATPDRDPERTDYSRGWT